MESEPAFAAWKEKNDRLKGCAGEGGGGEDGGGGSSSTEVAPSSSSSASSAAASSSAAADDDNTAVRPTLPQVTTSPTHPLDTTTTLPLDTNEGLSKENESSKEKEKENERDLPWSQCRLRFYNTTMKTCTDAFDNESSGSKTLESLYFNNYRALLLEIRSPEETFEVYYNDGFGLLIEEYDPIIGGMKPTRTVRVPRTCTVGVLKDLICSGSKQYSPSWSCPNVARDKMRLIRIVSVGR